MLASFFINEYLQHFKQCIKIDAKICVVQIGFVFTEIGGQLEDLGSTPYPIFCGDPQVCSFLSRCSFGEVVFSNSCEKKKGPSLFHPIIPLMILRDPTWSCLVPAAAVHFDSPKCEAAMERDEGDEGEHEGTQKTAILYFNSTNGTVDGRHPAPVDRCFIQLYTYIYINIHKALYILGSRISSINSIILTMPSLKWNVSKKGMKFCRGLQVS